MQGGGHRFRLLAVFDKYGIQKLVVTPTPRNTLTAAACTINIISLLQQIKQQRIISARFEATTAVYRIRNMPSGYFFLLEDMSEKPSGKVVE